MATQLLLAENPYGFDYGYSNPRRKRRKGGKRSRKNPMSLNRLLSGQGLAKELELMNTVGIATGFVALQKVSEAVGQTGFMDAIVVIGGSVVLKMMLGGNKFVNSLGDGGIALGLLKFATLIPGTENFVSRGSIYLGGRPGYVAGANLAPVSASPSKVSLLNLS